MTAKHHALPHHFTASGIVIAAGHVLLVNHKRIGAWVPPGGHIEENELPEETVVREILEETGILVEVISDPVPQTKDADAFFLSRPLYVQSVLAVERGERFYHIDLAYLCKPKQADTDDQLHLPALRHNPEVKEARWVKLSNVDELPLAKNVKEALSQLGVAKAQSFTRKI